MPTKLPPAPPINAPSGPKNDPTPAPNLAPVNVVAICGTCSAIAFGISANPVVIAGNKPFSA